MPSGQVWYLSANGGYFANPKLSMNLATVSQPRLRFRQFTSRDNDFGKSMGDTLYWNKVFNVTTAGGALTEGVPIPKTGITISRGTIIATEYGNSIPWTSKFETLSQFDTDDPLQNALINDQGKTMDRAVKAQYDASKVCYIPTGTVGTPTATWDNDGTPSTAATRDVALFDIKNCVDALRKGIFGTDTCSPVAPYDGQDYVCVGSVDFCRAIMDDPDWEDAARYGDPDRLWNGEVGRIYGCRVVMENHLLTTLGTSGYKGGAYIFGAETVKEIRVIPEEMRRALPGDYGRDKGMAWYALLGFKIMWEFVTVTEPMNSIIRITSS